MRLSASYTDRYKWASVVSSVSRYEMVYRCSTPLRVICRPRAQSLLPAATSPSAICSRRVDALSSASRSPALSRQVTETYFEVFERWRPRLFR